MADNKQTAALPSEENTLSDAPTVALESEKTSPLLAGEIGTIPPLDRRIGAYKLIRELGRGGMGAVYLASRADDQYEKLVAIKVVVRGLDTDFAVQRFRAERQILASLDHPNIARLLDGGTTTDGRPFFVMEYIEGKPIIEYSDENKLSIEDRLKLFRQVCSAVQYSHQNLVIHRDIKPGNILVTADGVPKLLDFGIAKILNPDLYPLGVDQTLTAMRLMTPQYASPEQARGEPVTTATDVYLLGVLLYELLTGQRPYKIVSTAPHEIIRVICDQEPDRPSTVITRAPRVTDADTGSTTDQSAFVSGLGEGSIDKLRRRLVGDLDIIVLKAIRKDPAARYGSVDLLSEDIRRHLEGKPIAARPDTLFYRAGKFIKRNKIPVAAVVLVILTLLGGIIATAWQASVARTQRAKAELRFNEVRKLANTFLFEFNDAIKDLPGSTPARELLVKSAVEYLDSLARESGDDPSLQRELAIAYNKIGDLQGNPYFPNLGDMEGSLASYQKSVAISEALVKADSSNAQYRHDLALGLAGMGDLKWGSGNSAEAIDFYRRAAEYESSVVAADAPIKDARLHLWSIYRSMAYAQAQAGDFDAGVETFNKSREVVEAIVAENPTDPKMRGYLATNYSSLGEVVGEKGDLAGALEYFRKALVIQQELESAQPTNVDLRIDVGISREKIGDVLDKQGDHKTALENFAKALEIFEYVSTADPTNAQASRNVAVENFNIGRMLAKLGNLTEALAHYRKSVAITEKLASVEGANLFVRAGTAITHSHIGIALAQLGDEANALEHSSKGIEIVEALLKENPENAEVGGVLANAYYNEAEVNSAIAEKGKVARNRQAELWRRARDYYQRSRDLLKDLSNRGAWISSDYKLPGDVDQKIIQCDAALAKLGVPAP